ncbi:hypothetical protein CMEL01_10043, partial [Colletotrichum melonis]
KTINTYPPIARPVAFRSTANLTHHSQTRLLLQACNASFQIGRVNLTLAEDLADEIAPAFSHLRLLPEGLFVRLDDCSSKDGAQIIPGRKPLHTIDEIILRIVISGRCQAALEICVKSQRPVELFFLRFDIRMAAEREYRVVCRPKDCWITATSQYH